MPLNKSAWHTRKDWQDFKKRYPKFEKSKNFKSDVGPQMDKFEKAFGIAIDATAAARLKYDEVLVTMNSLLAAMAGYEVVVKELENSEAAYKGKILVDFKKIHDELDSWRTRISQSIQVISSV